MNAAVNCPCCVFVSNGEVFICDTYNHCVRKLLGNGQSVTIAGDATMWGYNGDGQLATQAKLDRPFSVVVSSSNQVYISDAGNHRIRKIDRNGQISTIAGNGTKGYNGDDQLAVNAELNFPCGLFVTDEEEVFFCDYGNHRVRKIDRFGMISTIAGNGTMGYNGDDILATTAKLNNPLSVFVHKHEIYITDFSSHRIRKVLQNGIIQTIAGTGVDGYNGDDQTATSAGLREPFGLYVHNDRVYFTDYNNNRVRVILPNGIIKTIAGRGMCAYIGDGMLATESFVCLPAGLFVDDSGIYIPGYDSRIRKIDPNGIITTIVGTGLQGYSGDVSFDFKTYPHIGPKKKQWIKPFPKALYDLIIIHVNSHQNETENCDPCYEPLNKKVKR